MEFMLIPALSFEARRIDRKRGYCCVRVYGASLWVQPLKV